MCQINKPAEGHPLSGDLPQVPAAEGAAFSQVSLQYLLVVEQQQVPVPVQPYVAGLTCGEKPGQGSDVELLINNIPILLPLPDKTKDLLLCQNNPLPSIGQDRCLLCNDRRLPPKGR